MRRIRFKRELIKKIKTGQKIMTFRNTPRPSDNIFYKIEEGNRSIFDHVDSGIRIQMTSNWYVLDVPDYIKRYYREEGFDSPQEFEDCLRKLNRGKLPDTGYAHVFHVVPSRLHKRKQRGRGEA